MAGAQSRGSGRCPEGVPGVGLWRPEFYGDDECGSSPGTASTPPSVPVRAAVRTTNQSTRTGSWCERAHLEALRERFAELLGNCEILEDAGTDYAFRIFVGNAVWSEVLVGLSEELGYGNFKSEVARHQGRAGAKYEGSLHKVWDVMYGIQDRRG